MGTLIIGSTAILFGLFYILGKDVLWALTEWGHSLSGLVSERTTAWETRTTVSGVCLLVIGILILGSGVLEWIDLVEINGN